MELNVWVVSTTIPEHGEGPCIPDLFTTATAADAYVDEVMRKEWKAAEVEDDNGNPEEYPGDWCEAQCRLIEWNGPTWGTWAISKHKLTIPGVALHTVYGLATDGNHGTALEFFETEADRDNAIWGYITPSTRLVDGKMAEVDANEYRAFWCGDWGAAMDEWCPEGLTFQTGEYTIAAPVEPTPPAPEFVYVATIDAEVSGAILIGKSKEAVIKSIAGWCSKYWEEDEIPGDRHGLTDHEVVKRYFAHMGRGRRNLLTIERIVVEG